ncbi:MAG: exodeoxyribonuclease VII large subunit [Proteobacteria bacterium]|jgi:exodeoxyribonuclease VII large subunit|nr:exodeoxyribonuclease VII large subunit [Pseudomonadota bacterium]
MSNVDHIYQVSEFLAEVKSLLEMSYRSVWLEGEISSLRAPASGHLYFTLKDDNTQIRCAMFRNRGVRNRAFGNQAARNTTKPEEGQLVQVRAKFTLYEARGDVQLIVEEIKEAGSGQLLKQFEELKRKLAGEGLFAEQNKQRIPQFPKRLGIVTSSSGAALHDILSTLKRRNPGLPVVIYHSLVQGAEAPRALANALKDCAKHEQCDVVIIARGGGSIEDLACFNNEELARLIAAYPLPIISAIGHEVDFTIADFVADVRAATPTAAAELVAPERSTLLAELAARGLRMRVLLGQRLQAKAQAVDLLGRSITSPGRSLSIRFSATQLLGKQMHRALLSRCRQAKLQSSTAQLSLRRLHPKKQLADRRGHVAQNTIRLHSQIRSVLKEQQSKMALAAEKLRLVSPLGILERGYALAQLDKACVKSIEQLSVGDKLKVILSDGEVSTQVLELFQHNIERAPGTEGDHKQ